jgi:hypothetical protein
VFQEAGSRFGNVATNTLLPTPEYGVRADEENMCGMSFR